MVNASVPTLLREQVDRWARTWVAASRAVELNRLAAEPFMPKGRRQPSTPGRDVFDDDGS